MEDVMTELKSSGMDDVETRWFLKTWFEMIVLDQPRF